jgi:8-oxo-dGTP diphosphatase
MKRDFPDRPLVGVGAVIVDAGRALIIERGSEPLKGQWSIPGGALEVGETLRECAAREALEETGLRVEAGEVLEVFDSIYRSADGRVEYHYVLIDLLCRVRGGELRASSDAVRARWITAAELDSIPLAETARTVLRRAFAKAAER